MEVVLLMMADMSLSAVVDTGASTTGAALYQHARSQVFPIAFRGQSQGPSRPEFAAAEGHSGLERSPKEQSPEHQSPILACGLL